MSARMRSGDMNGSVPVKVSLQALSDRSRMMPKSLSFTQPSASTRIFAGCDN